MENLNNKVDSFILNDISDMNNCSISKDIHLNFTHNRFDLALKCLYLDLWSKGDFKGVSDIYLKHISAFSFGEYIEKGNDKKNTKDKFLNEFQKVFNSIKEDGFDDNKSLIPLASDGSILNGAHRAASSIYLGKSISALSTNLEPLNYNYDFFLERGVERQILDAAALEYIKRKKNVYLAIIWPASNNKSDLSKLFDKVVYKKKIKLNYNGAHNLLSIAYKGESWLGEYEDGYPGVNGKLIECFPTFDDIEIYLFEDDNISNVLEKKEKIRRLFKIDKHSIHITDNDDETDELSNYLLNDNSIHFLKYSKPYKFGETRKQLDVFKRFCYENNINNDDIILDGSLVLAVYGLRKASDIDFIINEKYDFDKLRTDVIDNHNNLLKIYDKSYQELIYDPNYYFFYDGLKFVSLAELKKMKMKRAESKDASDIHLINSIKANNSNLLRSYIHSKVRFIFSKYKLKFRLFMVDILQKLGCFDLVRSVYFRLRDR